MLSFRQTSKNVADTAFNILFTQRLAEVQKTSSTFPGQNREFRKLQNKFQDRNKFRPGNPDVFFLIWLSFLFKKIINFYLHYWNLSWNILLLTYSNLGLFGIVVILFNFFNKIHQLKKTCYSGFSKRY